jgi:hypothetical protein
MVESDEEALMKKKMRPKLILEAVPPLISHRWRTANYLFCGFKSSPPSIANEIPMVYTDDFRSKNAPVSEKIEVELRGKRDPNGVARLSCRAMAPLADLLVFNWPL